MNEHNDTGGVSPRQVLGQVGTNHSAEAVEWARPCAVQRAVLVEREAVTVVGIVEIGEVAKAIRCLEWMHDVGCRPRITLLVVVIGAGSEQVFVRVSNRRLTLNTLVQVRLLLRVTHSHVNVNELFRH